MTYQMQQKLRIQGGPKLWVVTLETDEGTHAKSIFESARLAGATVRLVTVTKTVYAPRESA